METIQKNLAAGVAHFSPEGLLPLLEWWASLANQVGPDAGPPNRAFLTHNPMTEVMKWAKGVRALGDEGDASPVSEVYYTDHDSILLSWSGTWTHNRWVWVEVFCVYAVDTEYQKPVSQVSHIVVTWETGTGRKSSFLDVERFLTLDACFDHEPLLDYETKVEQQAAAAAAQPPKRRRLRGTV